MKLRYISIKNFRSIVSADFPVRNHTVLVGKNNEGKSNVLAALNIAFKALESSDIRNPRPRSRPRHRENRDRYIWREDYPLKLQELDEGAPGSVALTFVMEGYEKTRLRKILASEGFAIAESVVLRMTFQPSGAVDITAYAPDELSSEARERVVELVTSHIETFNYIPTVRTEDEALDEIAASISARISELNADADYKAALKRVDDLERKLFDSMEQQIEDSLRVFFPDIANVSLKAHFTRRMHNYGTDLEIDFNDGTPSDIECKGEGVKSLVTLAILKDRKQSKAASIIAIEEPESHLHPGAIRDLRNTIRQIALNSQVLITTHNPVLISPEGIGSNIIVADGTCHQATSRREIREILGVLPSDNLRNAEWLLLVEGDSDRVVFEALLRSASDLVKESLNAGRLVVWPLGGASNLGMEIRRLRQEAYNDYLVILDDDKAGHDAVDKAVEEGVLDLQMRDSAVRFTICKDRKCSEIEDAIQKQCYMSGLASSIGVEESQLAKCFDRQSKAKTWSHRMGEAMRELGLPWNDANKANAKAIVARLASESIEQNGRSRVFHSRQAAFASSLIKQVEHMVSR